MFLVHSLIIIVTCVMVTISSDDTLPCIKRGTTEQCYKIVETTVTWAEASLICKADGGMLVIIESVEEQNFITEQMTKTKFTVNGLWMGSNNLHPEAQRTWANGNKFTYQNWAGGEPNGPLEEENCAEIYTFDGKWNDRSCTRWNGYICENSRSAKEYIQNERTGRWYKLADNLTTWTEAFNICKGEGGTLMIIETVQEQQFIESQIRKKQFTTVGLWIGSKSLHQETQHTWTNGRSFTFTNWARGEPNNSPLFENCAEIFTSNGKWNDQLCTHRRGYICEKTNQKTTSSLATEPRRASPETPLAAATNNSIPTSSSTLTSVRQSTESATTITMIQTSTCTNITSATTSTTTNRDSTAAPVVPNSSQQKFFVIIIALGSALVLFVGVLVLYCLIQKRTNCKKKKDTNTQDREKKEEGYHDLHDLATNQAEHVYNRSSVLDHNYCTIDDIV